MNMPELVQNNNFELQKEHFDNSLAQVATATMMAQSLSMCLERKHLIDISNSNYFELVKKAEPSQSLLSTRWIKISQVGCPANDNVQSCFEAMQNILQSCALPKTRLYFLIIGRENSFSIYLGVKGDGNSLIDFQLDVNNFINISWAGITSKPVNENSLDFSNIQSFLSDKYSSVHAITGIPSLNLQSGYPGTVEYIMGGQRNESMAYLVVADPLEEQVIDNIMYSCNEMQGQAESMKSFSFAESMQRGYNESIAKGHSITRSESNAIGESRKDPKKVFQSLLVGGGLIAAGLAFPAMVPFVNVLDFLATPVSNSGLGGIGIISALIPQKTKTNTIQNGSSDTTTETHGTSENYSKSLTKNLVNAHVGRVVEHLKKQVARYEDGKAIGMWNVGCYLFSNAGNSTSPLQLKSILSGKDSIYEPIRIHDISQFCNNADKHNVKGFIEAPYVETYVKSTNGGKQIYCHPFGQMFNGITTVLTTKELTCMANFPLHTVPGVNVVDATAEFSLSKQKFDDKENYVDVGKLLWSGSSTDINIHLPLNTLCRHALVCGVNGSGKTNSILSILDGFMKNNKPFFVIEPAKTEYVDWAIEYNKTITDPKKKIKIFIPGCEKYTKSNFQPEKLRFNPFEVISLGHNEPRALTHLDRLKATFACAFPMQDILPVIMEDLLYELYTETNPMLDKSDPLYNKKGFPALSTVNREFINELMKNIGYAQENTQNISAALRTRFKSLKYGWKGEMMNNEKLMGLTWSELFESPCILNLSYAGDDQDKSFITSLLLQFLYEYRQAESEEPNYSFNDNICRHLLVVEEAHRVMTRCDNPELPQYKSNKMYTNFLSEARAYGQGMMLVDQVPTRLIEDAIKNTNVKIIHKLVASDDAQRIAECIGLTTEQQKVIAKLSIGQAVLAGFNSANVLSTDCSDIYLAQINKMK